MLIVQLCLYCLIFTVMVKLAVRGGAVDGLYFYPKDVQERAIAIGLSDRATIDRKCKRFMTAFYLVMLVVLLGSSGRGTASRSLKRHICRRCCSLK